MDFTRYKKLVEKYYRHDCRELNFQNRILIPFLESLIPEQYDVVDSSTLYKNWKKINRDSFAGQYTPDVLVVKEWDLFDVKKKSPLIIVEVKRPTANDSAHADSEVHEYLNKSQYVILTDCIIWEIHEKDKATKYLYLDTGNKGVCKRDVLVSTEGRIVNWIDEMIPGNDWERLQNEIKEIINTNSELWRK